MKASEILQESILAKVFLIGIVSRKWILVNLCTKLCGDNPRILAKFHYLHVVVNF